MLLIDIGLLIPSDNAVNVMYSSLRAMRRSARRKTWRSLSQPRVPWTGDHGIDRRPRSLSGC